MILPSRARRRFDDRKGNVSRSGSRSGSIGHQTTPTCNSKSGTKQCPTPDYSSNTGYDEVSPIVTLAKRLCTLALCSSDVLLSTGPTIFRPDQETARRQSASHASPPCRENWPSEKC